MSSKFKSDDIIRLMKDSKQVAELIYNTITNHLEKCEQVKAKISDISKNTRKGISLDLKSISGAGFMEISEVTAMAPAKLKNILRIYRARLEKEFLSTTKFTPSVASLLRKFLNAFYTAYDFHYSKIFSEQLRALVALQSVISQSGEELAKSGAKGAQDANIDSLKKDIEETENETDEGLKDWLVDPLESEDSEEELNENEDEKEDDK